MAFRVRLDDPTCLPDLVDTLRRAECEAAMSGDVVEVAIPRAPSRAQAGRELRIYLAVWQAQHPETRATLLPG
jgi:hypothetical protein